MKIKPMPPLNLKPKKRWKPEDSLPWLLPERTLQTGIKPDRRMIEIPEAVREM